MVDLADLESKLDDRTAVFMITNPNTIGLFETEHPKITDMRPRQGRPRLPRRREHERHPRHHAAPATSART